MSEKRSLEAGVSDKSQKRIRLEHEIFDKSLRDIETMFNFSHVSHHLNPTSSLSSVPTTASLWHEHDHSQYTIPLVPGETNKHFNYDCINMAFLRNEYPDHHMPTEQCGWRNLYINTICDEDEDVEELHANLERDLALMDQVFMRRI